MTIANPTAALVAAGGLAVVVASWLARSTDAVAVSAVVFLPAFCLTAADQISKGVNR